MSKANKSKSLSKKVVKPKKVNSINIIKGNGKKLKNKTEEKDVEIRMLGIGKRKSIENLLKRDKESNLGLIALSKKVKSKPKTYKVAGKFKVDENGNIKAPSKSISTIDKIDKFINKKGNIGVGYIVRFIIEG